jgi:hypothetical protein
MAITTGQLKRSETYSAIRLAAIAGLVGNALGVLGVLVDRMWTFPGTGASASEIAGFVAAHRSALLIAMFLTTFAVGLWLLFGVGVWVWMRERASSHSALSMCFLVGLIGFVTLLLAGFTSFMVLVYRAGEVSDPRLLDDLAFGLLAMSGAPTVLALGAYATHVLRETDLPSWTAWLAVLAGVAHLVLLASLVVSSGFFSLEGGVTIVIPGLLFAWITATSILLLRDGNERIAS